ncbi:MAG: hypothetical protein K2F69_03680 [Bacteroidaceae bacterium]|nr:hypothetical protein [Bacteroidaceae bacterium]
MKKLFILAALSICNTAMAENANDTVTVEQPRSVEIISTENGTTVNIQGRKGEPAYQYSHSLTTPTDNYIFHSGINPDSWQFDVGPFSMQKNVKRNRLAKYSSATKFAFGWNEAPGAPAQMDVTPFKSWELWWIVYEQRIRPRANKNMFSVGIGLDWRNYRMKEDMRFTKQDGQIQLVGYPDGAIPSYSRIKVFSLNVPIRYQFRARKAGFSVGPVINFNLYSSLRTKYKLDGKKHIEKDNTSAYVTPVTVDLMATVRIGGILEIYAKYSPMDVLRTDKGPNFQSLSFGILL